MKTFNRAIPRVPPVVLALALVSVMPSAAQSGEAAERLTAVFLGFSSQDISASGLDILADLVRHEIRGAPGFELVEREGLEVLLREQELSVSDAADPTTALRVGALLGARKILVGKIGILGSLYIITIRMVDASSGLVDRSVTEEYIGPVEDLRKPVRIAAQKLLGIPGIEVQQGEFISVETDPPGVAVYVNGLFEGSAPVVVRVPSSGTYAVKLTADGFKTWSQNVKVGADSTYFLKARLLAQEKAVDERIKALQDGRVAFLTFLTLYSAVASDAMLYAFGSENPRLYIGLPLVAAPSAFFGALKATEGSIMNSGRTFMIVSGMLWGSAWGPAAAMVFGAEAGGVDAADLPFYTGLSLAGGLAYGAAALWVTRGDAPFPAGRAWLYNLGSILGSLLGLGVPYVLGAEDPGVIYAGMLAGSLAGSATALWLTRDLVEGRSIGNLAIGGPALDVDLASGRVTAGLPVPEPVPLVRADGSVEAALKVALASVRY